MLHINGLQGSQEREVAVVKLVAAKLVFDK